MWSRPLGWGHQGLPTEDPWMEEGGWPEGRGPLVLVSPFQGLTVCSWQVLALCRTPISTSVKCRRPWTDCLPYFLQLCDMNPMRPILPALMGC